MKIKREQIGRTSAVTIGEDGLLRVWNRCVDYSHPFVLLGEMVCFITSDSKMGIR